MQELLCAAESGGNIPISLVTEHDLAAWLAQQPDAVRSWVGASGFTGEKYKSLLLPDAQGSTGAVLLGLGALRSVDELTLWHAAPLFERLPSGNFQVATVLAPRAATQFVLGWLVGSYRFNAYRSGTASVRQPRLAAPAAADLGYALSAAAACAQTRDLINTPPNELGPDELAAVVLRLAAQHGAVARVVEGDELLRDNYPLIHAVGRGSGRAPRLIDLRWGKADQPRVTLVGKGVCFDSGGLDLKPSSGMALMKKDMGGAAVAIGCARMLMEAAAPISLRVLIPAVENSVDGVAYRPSDVLRSRKGLSVEIGNTDAEGRLVLADALTEADGEQPDLLLDFATLTGAARTALGPELPAVFSNDAQLLESLRTHGDVECDPVWPMPLWAGYDEDLGSKVADLNNIARHSFAGAIIGGLFLQRFVTRTRHWAHFDLYAWNARERPGRPIGAEAQCLRLAYRYIRTRFG